MASVVDICNLALSHLGDSATVASIDPPEGSAQAEHCANFYPIARDALLEMHPWKFATRRAALSALSVTTWGWVYAYAEPSDAIRVVAILGANEPSTATGADFEMMCGSSGDSMIMTDLEEASAIYVAATSDASKFSPLFTMALSWHLAGMLAGPILKGDSGAAEAKRCAQMMQAYLAQAKASDANQQMSPPDHAPAWISDR